MPVADCFQLFQDRVQNRPNLLKVLHACPHSGELLLNNKGDEPNEKYQYEHEKCGAPLPLSYQGERSPIIRVRMAAADFGHRPTHCFRLSLALYQAGIEGNHEVPRAGIVNVPQAEHQGLGPSLQKTANQSHEFIAG